jgi:hypothetical protein
MRHYTIEDTAGVVTGDWIDPGSCASQSRRDMMVSREEEKERMTHVLWVDQGTGRRTSGKPAGDRSTHPPAHAVSGPLLTCHPGPASIDRSRLLRGPRRGTGTRTRSLLDPLSPRRDV